MEKLENIAQTYSQAPWRKQLQFLGMFSLILVTIGIVAGIYLSVSAHAATLGRDIQTMQYGTFDKDKLDGIETLNREIEDLQSKLALISSASEMQDRASKLGFKPVDMTKVMYVKVPGYEDRQPASLGPHTEQPVVSAPVVPPEYTESLFDWLNREADHITLPLIGVLP
jgi:hypothetical protein